MDLIWLDRDFQSRAGWHRSEEVFYALKTFFEVARSILSRAEQAPLTPKERSEIIDVVTSILVYTFSTLSRSEIRAMLGINLSEEPRAIREAKEEAVIAVISRQLALRFQQKLPETLQLRLTTLPLPVLEDLTGALLDFNSLDDLENWITEHRPSGD